MQIATKQDLSEIRGIIYKITNKINNKSYIGQTLKTFTERYGEDWPKRCNKWLKNAIIKYGVKNFEINILESLITDSEKLDELEGFYAEKYNTYVPDGYNFAPCGTRKKRSCDENNFFRFSLNYSLKYNLNPPYILYKFNKEYVFEDIYLFMKQHNMKHLPAVRDLLLNNGKVKSYRGFTRENILPPLTWRIGEFFNLYFCDKNGNIFYYKNIKEMMDIENISKSHLIVSPLSRRKWKKGVIGLYPISCEHSDERRSFVFYENFNKFCQNHFIKNSS